MMISKGVTQGPEKVVIYGVPGVGKSEFAAQFPAPLFIDIEGSTKHMDVARTEKPTSWAHFMEIINEMVKHPECIAAYQTIIIDSGDWAEQMCIKHICDEHKIKALGGNNDFGHSFNLLVNEWSQFLTTFDMLNKHRVVVVHSVKKQTTIPEEHGKFDSYQFDMESKTAPVLEAWADSVLFCRFRVLIIEETKTKQKVGQSGGRQIELQNNPCWTAKNRWKLFDPIPFDWTPGKPHPGWAAIAPHIQTLTCVSAPVVPATPAPQTTQPAPVPAPVPLSQLRSLMARDNIRDEQVEYICQVKGYFPEGTPLENYPADFVSGRLVAGWSKVLNAINNHKGELSNVN